MRGLGHDDCRRGTCRRNAKASLKEELEREVIAEFNKGNFIKELAKETYAEG